MAVVITSKFYQDDEWKDISKVVFTSPNMVSPSVAGTRSHILPGEGDLGMWYEDTSMMYRVEDHQEVATTDFYNFAFYVAYDTTLSGITDLYIREPNYEGIDTYIQERSGVVPIGYKEITVNLKEVTARLEYTLVQEGLDSIIDDSNVEVEESIESETRKCLTILSSTPTDCSDVFCSFTSYSSGLGATGAGGLAAPAAPLGYTTTRCTTMTHSISSSTSYLYNHLIKRGNGWIAPVIESAVNCYLTFEFYSPLRVTAVYLESIRYREIEAELPLDLGDNGEVGKEDFIAATKGNITVTVDYTTGGCDNFPGSSIETYGLDPDIYGTLCENIREMDETELSAKRYFIGNYEIQASTDGDSWITLTTTSNTDNISSYVYLTNNGQYFKYYRINILNNTSLDSDEFNEDFYGIRGLKFYAYEFSEEVGDSPIATYDFDNVEDPKIIKVSNVRAELGPLEEEGTTTVVDVEGDGWITTYSGATGPATAYQIDLASKTDLDDYVTNAIPLATVISGIGIDAVATTYVAEDDLTMEVQAEASYTPISGSPGRYTLDFTAFGTTTIPVDTVDYSGQYDIDYTTIASGVNTISGSPLYEMEGQTTRVFESSLRQKNHTYKLTVDSSSHSEGTLLEGTELNLWGYVDRPLGLDTLNSVVFGISTGEAYNCRLTAWDDVTHSTLVNELLYGLHARCSAAAFCCGSDILSPSETKDPINMIRPPVHNLIVKGNTVYEGTKYFYGDFDMVYRYQDDIFGDYLMFKPYLIGIHPGISYGVHDFIMTLHYSYT